MAEREPSYEVAHCQICGAQWVHNLDGEPNGCAFCDAPANAIVIESEKPTYGGADVVR